MKARLHKELVDQSAHFAAAFLIVAGAQALGAALAPLAGLWLGFALGFVRELTEEGEISFPALKGALHSRLDLTFWTIGGIAGAALL